MTNSTVTLYDLDFFARIPTWVLVVCDIQKFKNTSVLEEKERRRYGEESCGDYHGDGAMDGGVFVPEYWLYY